MLAWQKEIVRVDQRIEPTIVDPRDAIVRVTLTAICGSDLQIESDRPAVLRDVILACRSGGTVSIAGV